MCSLSRVSCHMFNPHPKQHFIRGVPVWYLESQMSMRSCGPTDIICGVVPQLRKWLNNSGCHFMLSLKYAPQDASPNTCSNHTYSNTLLWEFLGSIGKKLDGFIPCNWWDSVEHQQACCQHWVDQRCQVEFQAHPLYQLHRPHNSTKSKNGGTQPATKDKKNLHYCHGHTTHVPSLPQASQREAMLIRFAIECWSILYEEGNENEVT